MGVVMAMVMLILGGALMGCAAFFLGRCWDGMAALLPALLVVMMAAVWGYGEVAAGMIWGTVAVHSLLMGILGIGHDGWALLWMAFGWGACVIGGAHGCGVYTGWALLVVGLMAAVLGLKQINPGERVKPSGRWWWGLLAVVLAAGGAGLLIGWCGPMTAVFGLPSSIFAAVVLAPMVGVWGLMPRNRRGLANANVGLSTVGLGLAAVMTGGLHFTPSLLWVVLPWVGVMVVMTAVTKWLPQKTAPWWRGLMVALFVGYLITLLG